MTNEPLTSKINTCKIKEMTIPLKNFVCSPIKNKIFSYQRLNSNSSFQQYDRNIKFCGVTNR